MTHLTHEDPNRVYACPDCDAAAITHRCPDHPGAKGDSEFRCRDCDRDVLEPVARKKYDKNTQGRGARSNLEMLLDQNPSIKAEYGTGFEPASSLSREGGDA